MGNYIRTLIVVSVASSMTIGGCTGGGQAAEKESKELRDTMTSKEGFDINKVPPEHREKVRQMVGGGGNPAATKGTGGATAGSGQ